MTEIEYMRDQVDFNNLTYYFKILNINSLNFIICDDIKNGETSIEEKKRRSKTI